MKTVRVWDLPTRLFHWLLAVCVVAMVVTAKVGGGWMEWHLRLGHVVLALLVFRVVWGLVGGHWSRFARFLYGPATVLAYLRGRPHPEHEVGHSPLGALSVFALLGVLLVQVGTGLMSDDEIAFTGPLVAYVPGEWVEAASRYHKAWGEWLVLGLVGLHLLAIVFYTQVKRQALVRPMLTGDKVVAQPIASSADGWRQRLLALALLLACGALAWWVHGLGAPAY